MADSNYVSGLGARRAPSAVGLSYLKTIQEAGEKLAGTAMGYTQAQVEIARREAEARSRVKDADFTNDEATKSMFANDARELRERIGGLSEDAYDFSKVDDIARFENDLGVLNKELDDAEVVYNEAVKNFKDLEQQHDLFVKVGEDPNQAATTKIDGVGEVYNAKAGTMEFNLAMQEGAFMRDSNVTKSGGKYIMRDENGSVIKVYDTKQDYFADLVALSKPDMQPVPVLTGRDKVIKEKWGALYDTEAKAESAFVEYVLNNPEATRRRAQEKADAPGSDFRRSFTNPAAQKLIDKHPTSSRGFDQMSDDQYDYVQEMLQEWRDEQKRLKKDTPSGSGKVTLLDQIGDVKYTKNEGLADETTIGGTGVALKGQVIRTGEMRGARVQQLIYNPADETYTVVVTDPDGFEADFELDPSPQSYTRTSLVGALNMSNEQMDDLLSEIRRRGQ
jgi:hypothetical protein